MNLMGENFESGRYNKTEQQYRFDNAIYEWFGADEEAKVRGPRRDILFLNEANNIPWDTARALDVRTSEFTFADWNPVSEFWAHEYWVGKPENAYIHSTYKDAQWALLPEVVKNIESNKNDPNWWNVYGLGLIGKVEGLVYPFYSQIDQLPDVGERSYGLDFGYSNDPTVLIDNRIDGDKLYSDEVIYQTSLTNLQLGELMVERGVKKHEDFIFADEAEPKSIQELCDMGFVVVPCPKGKDSVEFGHQKIRQFKQYWTKRSVNAIKEQRNFRYLTDKDGKYTEKTTHVWSHAMDARRYGVVGLAKKSYIDIW